MNTPLIRTASMLALVLSPMAVHALDAPLAADAHINAALPAVNFGSSDSRYASSAPRPARSAGGWRAP